MANNGSWSSTATPSGNNSSTVTIPAGYHDGSGKVTCNGGTAYTAGQNYGRTEKQSEYHAVTVEYVWGVSRPYMNIRISIHANNSASSAVIYSFIVYDIYTESDMIPGGQTPRTDPFLIPHSWKGVFSLA
jgi:hypothetical protein